MSIRMPKSRHNAGAAMNRGEVTMRRVSCVTVLTLWVLVLGSACGANSGARSTVPTVTVHPQLLTYVASGRVDPGTPRSVSVSCRPGEQMLGGGFGTGDLFEYAAYIEASYPSGAATWTVTGAAPASYFYMEAEVYCLPVTIPIGLHVVQVAGAPAATAACLPYTVLLGGGFQASQPVSVSRPQGNGWLSAASDAPSGASVHVYALCAARSVLAGRVISAHFNAHSSVRDYAPDSADVACSRGQIAVGGGFTSGDLMVGSQALGLPFAGWSVAAGGDADVTIFAVCVILKA
jgi:hypothetical protein